VPRASSDWCPNPSQAYRKARDGLVRDNQRPNGHLFVGLNFSHPQQHLREYFRSTMGAAGIMVLGENACEWLQNVAPSPRSVSAALSTRATPTSPLMSFPPVLPVSHKRTPSYELHQTLRQLSIDDWRNASGNMAPLPDAAISEMWAKRRNKAIDDEESVFYDLLSTTIPPPPPPPPLPSLPPLPESESRLASMGKHESIKEAMMYLRGLSREFSEGTPLGAMPPASLVDLFMAVKSNAVHLDRAQMHRAVSLLLQLPVSRELTNKLFDYCDADRDGKLTVEEFVNALETHERSLRREFELLDTDGDGAISVGELRNALKDGDVDEASEEEINLVLRAFSFSKQRTPPLQVEEQRLGWAEFRSMMLLLPPTSSIKTVLGLVKSMKAEADEEAALLKEFEVT